MTDSPHGADKDEAARNGATGSDGAPAGPASPGDARDGGSAWPAPAGPASSGHPAPPLGSAPHQTAPYVSPAQPGPTPDQATTLPIAGSAQPGFGSAASAPVAPKRKSNKALPLVAMLAVGALIGGAAGGLTVWAVAHDDAADTASVSQAPANITVNDPDNATPITAVAAKASGSVVTIDVAGAQEGGTGSGVVLSSDGYVLTNTHVVTLDGKTGDATIQVKTADGALYTAKLVGTDPVVDLAVVKLDNVSGLTPIEFADSSKLNVGDTAIAIGAPLGLSGTVTDGIVSALNRSIQVASSAAPSTPGDGSQSDETPFNFWPFGNEGQGGQGGSGQQGGSSQVQPAANINLAVIQTDAAINPGNSGGALLDGDGKLIGVNVAIANAGGTSSTAGSIGVGFAIPSNLAKRVGEEIIKSGKASHGLLGASVRDVATGDSTTPVGGAFIADVQSGGAAASAGLQKGDIVTALGGTPIGQASDLTAQVRALPGGTDVKLTVLRGGQKQEIDVKLGTLEQ